MNRRVLVLVMSAGVIIFLVALLLSRGVKKPDAENPDITLAHEASVQENFKQAEALEGEGELLKAQDMYQDLIDNFPSFNKIQEVEERLGNLNIRVITSGIQTDQTAIYEVKPKDSLSKISKQFGTTVELIKKSNSLTSDIIRVGARLRIWKDAFSCVVDKSQNILILKSDDRIVKKYNVSTGANNSTPVGIFRIVNKLVDPVWYKAGAVVPADSPENILGTRWMGFDLSGYGIHGTTDPSSIGQQITAGCVRLANPNVEELYMLLPVGVEVTVVD